VCPFNGIGSLCPLATVSAVCEYETNVIWKKKKDAFE
jgi:hypothetical protein